MSDLLERKKKVLIRQQGEGRPLCVILDPKKVSPDGKFIKLGDFHSDEVSGYYPLDEICSLVVSVLEEF